MNNVSMQTNLDALQAQQATGQTADISAFANQNINLEATPAADTLELSTQEQPKKKGGMGKLVAGLAAAGIIGFGIFKWVKGKGGKTVDLEDLSKLKEYLANNKNFTGTVTGKVGEAGNTAKLVYKKGVLQQSTKLDKEGKEIFTKLYESADGKISKVTKKVADKADEVTSYVYGKDGKLSQTIKDVHAKDLLVGKKVTTFTKDASGKVVKDTKFESNFVDTIVDVKPTPDDLKVDTPESGSGIMDGPKKGSHKADAPKTDVPKADAPKADAPKVDAPKADAPKTSTEAPKLEPPKADALTEGAPKADAPKVDTPKADAPKADTPKVAPKKPVVFKSLDKRTKAWQKEGATIRQDNLKLLKQLDPKVVKRMPDSFLEQPLTAPTSFWWKQEGIDALKEFTPDQMTKIMNNPYGPNSVSNLLTGCYNTKTEYNELLNYLRAMTK